MLSNMAFDLSLFVHRPSFGASIRLCFVSVIFPGYRHIYFVTILTCWLLFCILFCFLFAFSLFFVV